MPPKPLNPVKKTKSDGTQRKLRGDGNPDQRGGFRPGSGRPKGALTKQQRYTLGYYRSQFAVQPLDYFLSILNGEPQMVEIEKEVDGEKVITLEMRKPTKADRMEAAKAAAPYMHQRLTAVQMTGADGESLQQKIDVTKLTDEELNTLEAICIKALTPVQIIEHDINEHPNEDDISVEYSEMKE